MRQLLNVCGIATAAIALAAWPQESAPAAATGPASTVKAERPEVKVGDQWKFACAGSISPDLLWVVTSVDQTGIKGTENG